MIVKNITTDCIHCGLPVPAGLLKPGREEQFCCHGCETAYELIHDSGLDAFYRMVDSDSQSQTLRERTSQNSNFLHFDDETFLRQFARQKEPDNYQIRLLLDGIHCAACVWLIEKLPTMLPGVNDAKVNWSQGMVQVDWTASQINLSQIAQALYKLGYTPHPVQANEKSSRRQRENRQHLIRIGVAAAAAGNNMLIAAALYLGMWSYMSAGMESLLRIASCVIGLVSLAWPGRIFLRGAINAFKTRTPHMDLPIALGLTVGSVVGLINTVRGAGEIYFDSISVLIFLLLVGRWIQFRQQNRAIDAIEMLYRLTPQRSRKQVDDRFVEVPVEEISVGDVLELRPGDLVPVDAEVIEGESSINESILSGESRPAKKMVGDTVSAGTKNLNSVLLIEARAVGEETRIHQIVQLVEQAANERPQVVEWANRIGGYFVVTVIVLAIATFAGWSLIDLGKATDRAVALLIVACPCALALATPLAVSVALGRLARRQIMVKAGDVLQSLNQPGMIWLDKTGTLTEGKLQVVQWHGDREWIPVVAAVETNLIHPVAHAFIEFAEQWDPCHVQNLSTTPHGVTATVSGYELLIGNRKLIESQPNHFPALTADWIRVEAELIEQGLSPCWIAVDGQVKAIAGLGDCLRADAHSVVENLRQHGWSIGILSGDHPEIVHQVARELNIDRVYAGVTPERKLEIVRRSSDEYKTTVMVGDGVNDSAALAAATVGIAVHQGAEASLAAAPVFLGRNGLDAIAELFCISQSAARTIRYNFVASLSYNLLGAGLAIAGWINPLIAAILMPVSSLTVIALSVRN